MTITPTQLLDELHNWEIMYRDYRVTEQEYAAKLLSLRYLITQTLYKLINKVTK